MKQGKVWALAAVAGLLAACSVGPKYARPTAPVPDVYKEQPPASFKESGAWKVSEPRDDTQRGKWWEIFGDLQLNALEDQVNPSNQTLALAEAQFRAARAAVRVTRSGLFPTITGGFTPAGSQISGTRSTSRVIPTSPSADLQIPFDASYEADVWRRIHSSIEAGIAGAQASAGDLETVRLSLQAELALDYFQLHGLDAQKQLLDTTVAAYDKAVELTQNRYNQGVASRLDVVQAQTQLETIRAQATDTGVQRAQFEHAIAILIGKPPAEFSIRPAGLAATPPVIPVGVPSQLLERRPDIAAAERRVAAANSQIGVAKAAFYPTLNLSAGAGLESANLIDLFS